MNAVQITKFDSLALKVKSEHYPASWHGKVPSRIRMDKSVTSDLPYTAKRVCAVVGQEYDAYVNSHGALCAILGDRELLGLKPYEFTVIAWHQSENDPAANDYEAIAELKAKVAYWESRAEFWEERANELISVNMQMCFRELEVTHEKTERTD